MYLLNLNRKGDIYKDDNGITGVPEFLSVLKTEKLGSTALKWVALVFDYESPYRHVRSIRNYSLIHWMSN